MSNLVSTDWLAAHGYEDLQEVSHTEERLTFALPQELRRDLRTAAATRAEGTANIIS